MQQHVSAAAAVTPLVVLCSLSACHFSWKAKQVKLTLITTLGVSSRVVGLNCSLHILSLVCRFVITISGST